MWEDKGLIIKFDLALKETDFFVYALNREERRITQKEIARNDDTRPLDVRNTDFLPAWASTSRSCTGPRRGESDRWSTFCESRGHALNP